MKWSPLLKRLHFPFETSCRSLSFCDRFFLSLSYHSFLFHNLFFQAKKNPVDIITSLLPSPRSHTITTTIRVKKTGKSLHKYSLKTAPTWASTYFQCSQLPKRTVCAKWHSRSFCPIIIHSLLYGSDRFDLLLLEVRQQTGTLAFFTHNQQYPFSLLYFPEAPWVQLV